MPGDLAISTFSSSRFLSPGFILWSLPARGMRRDSFVALS